jgi:hypothetical protein
LWVLREDCGALDHVLCASSGGSFRISGAEHASIGGRGGTRSHQHVCPTFSLNYVPATKITEIPRGAIASCLIPGGSAMSPYRSVPVGTARRRNPGQTMRPLNISTDECCALHVRIPRLNDMESSAWDMRLDYLDVVKGQLVHIQSQDRSDCGRPPVNAQPSGLRRRRSDVSEGCLQTPSWHERRPISTASRTSREAAISSIIQRGRCISIQENSLLTDVFESWFFLRTFAIANSKSSCVTCCRRSRRAYMPNGRCQIEYR